MKKKAKNQFDKNKIWQFEKAENPKFEGTDFLKLMCVISVLLTSPENYKQIVVLNRENVLIMKKLHISWV